MMPVRLQLAPSQASSLQHLLQLSEQSLLQSLLKSVAVMETVQVVCVLFFKLWP